MKYNVLDEIENILSCECSEGYVSVFQIVELLRGIHKEQDKLNSSYVDIMDIKLKNHFNREHYLDKKFFIYNCWFDFDRNQLCLYIYNYSKEIERYYFSKKNGELVIIESKNDLHKKEIFELLKSDLSELYDSYCALIDINKSYSHNIDLLDSEFKLNINYNVVELFIPKNYSLFERLVSLVINTYVDENSIDAHNFLVSSNDFVNCVEENYLDILKHAYVKLEDCPSWMHDKLNSYDKVKSLKITN